MKNKFSTDTVVGFLIILALCAVTFVDGINSLKYQIIGYDEGWNATVAANVMRDGVYMVSYPQNIVFYNLITTGIPVILPTALLYCIFGINGVTSGIVALIYSILSIFALWWLFCRCFKKQNTSVLAALITVSIVLADSFFLDISTHLIGESACLFFVLMSCVMVSYGLEKKANRYYFFAGIFLMASFLTKSSMIFFLVSLTALILVESIISSQITKINWLYFMFGEATCFLGIEIYKCVQLGSFYKWLLWWRKELSNMLSQSSGIDTHFSIIDKVRFLKSIFGVHHLFALLIIFLPVSIYLYYFIMQCVKKGKHNIDKGAWVMLYCAIGGASLEVFFVLLGGRGLVYARRHFVNELFVKCFFAYMLGCILYLGINKMMRKNEDKVRKTGLIYLLELLLILVLLVPQTPIYKNCKEYCHKRNADDYDATLMKDFLNEVSRIDDDATLYCYGWWQEPNVTLFLDRKMIDICTINFEELDAENGYLIIGRRFDNEDPYKLESMYSIRLEEIDLIDVDYTRLDPFSSDKLFTIYKIVK